MYVAGHEPFAALKRDSATGQITYQKGSIRAVSPVILGASSHGHDVCWQEKIEPQVSKFASRLPQSLNEAGVRTGARLIETSIDILFILHTDI
jgi:hypothetical protein